MNFGIFNVIQSNNININDFLAWSYYYDFRLFLLLDFINFVPIVIFAKGWYILTSNIIGSHSSFSIIIAEDDEDDYLLTLEALNEADIKAELEAHKAASSKPAGAGAAAKVCIISLSCWQPHLPYLAGSNRWCSPAVHRNRHCLRNRF